MKNIAAALIKARGNFPAIHKNKVNPHFKNKYASLDSILESITPALSDAGIVMVQPTIIRDGVIVLSTQLIHAESGESIESELIIPQQSDPQKLGSAMTYYRRFSICSLLAIAADDDDDGTTATNNAISYKSTIKSSNPPPLKSIDERKKHQEALRDCMEILEWGDAKKALWAKSISEKPFGEWSVNDWQRAVVKAQSEIDTMNNVDKLPY